MFIGFIGNKVYGLYVNKIGIYLLKVDEYLERGDFLFILWNSTETSRRRRIADDQGRCLPLTLSATLDADDNISSPPYNFIIRTYQSDTQYH